jgi:hypothetical protein
MSSALPNTLYEKFATVAAMSGKRTKIKVLRDQDM